MKKQELRTNESTGLRKKAEELLKQKLSKTDRQLSETDTLKLLHELDVHRVELELQNQELAAAKEQAELAAEKYCNLYDFAPSGYFTLSGMGEILEVNLCGAKMLGKERKHLFNNMFSFFITVDTRPAFNSFLVNVFNSKTPQYCEVTLKPRSDIQIFVNLTGNSSENGEFCLLTIFDVTDRKLAEKALENSMSLLNATLESIHNGILVVNSRGEVMKTNARFAEMWHIPEAIIAKGNDQMLLNHVLDQLADPNEFLAKVNELYLNPESETNDIINFRDGRIFERISKPMDHEGKPQGRVWSFLDITERKLAEDRYRLLADHTSEIVWMMDMDLKTSYQSPSSVRMRGFSLDELKVLPLEKNLTPESFQRAINVFSKEIPIIMSDSGYNPVTSIELEYYRKDGTTFWLENKFSIIRDNVGKAIFILGEGRDITDRRAAQLELKLSQSRFRQIVNQLNDVVWQANGDGTGLIDLSNSLESFYGVSSAEFTNNPQVWIDMVYQEDRHLAEKSMQELFSTGKTSADYRIQMKNGQVKWLNDRKSILYDDNGNAILMGGVAIDITERKLIEEQLQIKNYAVENSPIALGLADLDGIITYVNKAFLNLFGFENILEIVGRSVLCIATTNDNPERIITSIKQGNDFNGETGCLRKNGEKFDSIISSSVIKSNEGAPICMIALFVDITDRKKSENEIQLLNDTLENRVTERTKQLQLINEKLEFYIKEIEQFTYIASHDLSEPLNGMTNFTNLLHEEYAGELDEDGNKSIDFIYQSANRMKLLLKGLLDYSLLGKDSVKADVDCNIVVAEVLSDLGESIDRSNAKVTLQGLHTVHGCYLELRILFRNLIDNAIKFQMPELTPVIEVSAEKKEKEWIFSVKDNGIGIKERDRESIFIIFKRMVKREEFDGIGIGLAYCKKIVEMHGGRIWVESNESGGSTFRFTIPLLTPN